MRQADHPIDRQFLDRWSPRAFDGSPVAEADMMTMFEAARWSPSANNSQSWRFSYALSDGPDWGRFCDLLMDGNRAWARNAGAIVIVMSRNTLTGSDGKERKIGTHAFDTGAASLAIQLQAWRLGYAAHPIGGIHQDRIRESLALPDETVTIHAAIIIGRQAPADTLPEGLRAREVMSGRNPLPDFVSRGGFVG